MTVLLSACTVYPRCRWSITVCDITECINKFDDVRCNDRVLAWVEQGNHLLFMTRRALTSSQKL